MRNVENRIPNPPATPVQSKKLPEFKQFVEKMKPLLTPVQQDELDSLLKCLYEAAENKIEFERLRLWAQDNEPKFRIGYAAVSAATKPIKKALEILRQAKEQHSDALKEIEEKTEGEAGEFTFGQIIQFLEDALEIGDNLQLVYAAHIHPQLCKAAISRYRSLVYWRGLGLFRQVPHWDRTKDSAL
jgi:hypothetical protein